MENNYIDNLKIDNSLHNGEFDQFLGEDKYNMCNYFLYLINS
jgi:hypothetical protein